MPDKYIPGTCNIGKEQLEKRKRFAVKCIAATLICFIFLQASNGDKILRLLMVIPFTLSSIGFQQVYFKFCYLFGLKGLYGLGELGKTVSVEEENARKLDRKKSTRILISSLVIGILLAVIYFYLPI